VERIVFFLDYANINRSAQDKGIQINYEHLLQYIAEGRFLIDAHSYVPIDPRNPHFMDRVIEELWSSGYIVNTKEGSIAGDNYKCDFDVEITMDILKVIYQVKPDIIVLGTGDSDFIPVVKEVRKSGFRIEIASFISSASRELILKCSGFISLDKYCEESLAEYDEEENPENIDE